VSDVLKLNRAARRAAEKLPAIIAQTMRDALTLIGNTAATKFMVVSGTGKGSKLPGADSPVNPSMLTWRSGRLARSLFRRDNPENITRVFIEGDQFVGEVGTRVPYAAIHEYGGTIPARVQPITPRMRSFFWARWYATGGEKWKHMALKRKSPALNIPAISMPARPFLSPTTEDGVVREGVMALFANRVSSALASTMRMEIGGGAGA